MPWDGFDNLVLYETGETWDAFEQYLCAPYKGNPYLLAEMKRWFDGIHRSNRYHLYFVIVQNKITGRCFEAFQLHEQMLISHSPDVLAAPFPRDENTKRRWERPDKYVGVYLHDFGYDEEFFQACEREIAATQFESERKVSRDDPQFGPYAARISEDLDAIMRDLPGGKANNPAPWKLRFGHGGYGWHKDDSEERSRNRWTRVIIHPLVRRGTDFALGGRPVLGSKRAQERVIPCPVGATSSHLAIYGRRYGGHGISHGVPIMPEGRAILIKPDNADYDQWEPYPGIKTPFEVKPRMLSEASFFPSFMASRQLRPQPAMG